MPTRTSELVLGWTGRTLRARYQQSWLGWLWALVQPAAAVAVYTLVFTKFVPIDTGKTPYVVFAYVAVVPWTFLSLSLSDMTTSLVDNMALVKKIYFPRHALPVAAMLARMADAAVAALLLAALMAYFAVPVDVVALLFLPAVVAVQVTLVLGVGLLTAALNVFTRDVRSVVALGVQVWFYASPVIYPVDTVPASFRDLYRLNPMAGVLEGYRSVLLRGEPPGGELVTAAVASALVLLGGWITFRALEPHFADVV